MTYNLQYSDMKYFFQQALTKWFKTKTGGIYNWHSTILRTSKSRAEQCEMVHIKNILCDAYPR